MLSKFLKISLSGIIILLFQITGNAAETAEPPEKDKTGLFGGMFQHGEEPGKTREEIHLSLKPLPSQATERPFWLYVPKSYQLEKPPDLMIVLHKRGRLKSFFGGMKHTVQHLSTYAGGELMAWRTLADKKGFLLALPLGDVDILHMGIFWQTRDRTIFFTSLIENIKKTHSYKNVYIAATGEGAHAAIATAVQSGNLIQGVIAANPPLFTGTSQRPYGKNKNITIILPESIPEMLENAGKQKPVILIYAGNQDKHTQLQSHRNSGIPDKVRYQDTGAMSADHLKKMAKLFQDKDYRVELQEIPGRHYSPFPFDKIEEAWTWLKKQH